MSLLLVLLLLAVIGAAVALVADRLPSGMTTGMDAPTSTRPYRPLPEGPLRSQDVPGLKFSLAFRGYRMSEVDQALQRLEAELAQRDADLAQREADLAQREAELARRDAEASPGSAP